MKDSLKKKKKKKKPYKTKPIQTNRKRLQTLYVEKNETT